MIRYLKSSYLELKENVSWQKRSDAQKSVLVVVSFSVAFSILVWGIDTAFSRMIVLYFKLFS